MFNPVLYANAMVNGNLELAKKCEPASYELDSTCACRVDATFTPEAWYSYNTLFKVEKNSDAFQVAFMDADNAAQNDFSWLVYNRILQENGAYFAHVYAEKCKVNDKIHFMFIRNNKPFQKSVKASFRDTARFITGYKLIFADIPGEPSITEASCYLDIRFYGTNSRNYAAVWIHDCNEYSSGFGMAGGYGYDRMEAALVNALRACGFAPCALYGGYQITARAFASYLAESAYASMQWVEIGA